MGRPSAMRLEFGIFVHFGQLEILEHPLAPFVGNWSGPRALGAWTGRGLCPFRGRGHISGTVFFMYPYVFVAGLNKHDACSLSHVPMEREIRHLSTYNIWTDLPIVRTLRRSRRISFRAMCGLVHLLRTQAPHYHLDRLSRALPGWRCCRSYMPALHV